eukprot:1160041-Pelagomonas_calceolata.AAC.9
MAGILDLISHWLLDTTLSDCYCIDESSRQVFVAASAKLYGHNFLSWILKYDPLHGFCVLACSRSASPTARRSSPGTVHFGALPAGLPSDGAVGRSTAPQVSNPRSSVGLQGQHSVDLQRWHSVDLQGQCSVDLQGQHSVDLQGRHSVDLQGQCSVELQGQYSVELQGRHLVELPGQYSRRRLPLPRHLPPLPNAFGSTSGLIHDGFGLPKHLPPLSSAFGSTFGPVCEGWELPKRLPTLPSASGSASGPVCESQGLQLLRKHSEQLGSFAKRSHRASSYDGTGEKNYEQESSDESGELLPD